MKRIKFRTPNQVSALLTYRSPQTEVLVSYYVVFNDIEVMPDYISNIELEKVGGALEVRNAFVESQKGEVRDGKIFRRIEVRADCGVVYKREALPVFDFDS